MSIFKDTLKPYVAAQLKARQTVVSNEGFRDETFLRYTTGKNSWVRMTSFVDYNNSQSLARKYILEGGTLYNKANDVFALREGVGSKGSVYVNDIDLAYGTKKSDRPFGIRPMPGIINADIINKSAYGSLREATVKFYAWDKHQLEELELLYMRTGYTVLLEWGWSQYLTHSVANSAGINNINIGTPLITNFNTPTINCFQAGLNDDVVYDTITSLSEKTYGNYDAMLGYVKNFSWQLMPNGGFECSTILISRGEVISTLKLSSNSSYVIGDPTVQDKPALTQFEKALLSIKAHINNSEIVNPQGELYAVKVDPNATTPPPPPPPITQTEADATYESIKTLMASNTFIAFNDGKTYTAPSAWFDPIGLLRPCEGGNDGTAIEYIRFDKFIHLLNCLFGLKNGDTGEFITQIVVPIGTPCLASEDSVSVDPETCIIKNSKATFVTDKPTGFDPVMYYEWDGSNGGTTLIPEFVQATGFGDISSIYVSINKLLEIYRSMASNNKDGVLLVTYLQKLLDSISFALGGINNFKLHNDKNIIKIIDIAYLEKGAKYNDKFEFDLIGLKSICRDVKISSKIFESQSTMIAISAQNRANIGDIYSSTQNYLNKGLTDRLVPNKVIGQQLPDELEYYKAIYANLANLSGYLKKKVIGEPFTSATGTTTPFNVTTVPQQNEVSNASNLLKTTLLQLNGKDLDFKALIPFELEITLDGIGGFVQGQIFTINQSILPKSYSTQKVGFIITGISHSLQNNDWTTIIKTQVCLLDPIFEGAADKTKLKEIITEYQKLNNQATVVWCALADYMVYATDEYIRLINSLGTYTDGTADVVNLLNGKPIGKTGIAYFDNGSMIKGDYAKQGFFTLTGFRNYYQKWNTEVRSTIQSKLGATSPLLTLIPMDLDKVITLKKLENGQIVEIKLLPNTLDDFMYKDNFSFLTRSPNPFGSKYNIPLNQGTKTTVQGAAATVKTETFMYYDDKSKSQLFNIYYDFVKQQFKGKTDPLFDPNNSRILVSKYLDVTKFKQ